MKYGIVANPAAGKLSINEKRKALDYVKQLLDPHDCLVEGLDTESAADFRQCSADLAAKVETLVVAGGDGSVHDVINSVDSCVVLAYLPFGSGNMLTHALNLPRNVLKAARQIKNGEIHSLDLILCDGTEKAMIASIGIDSYVLNEREAYMRKGWRGFGAYAVPAAKSLPHYERFDATINDGEKIFSVPGALSIVVAKIPFYGYGMKIVPKAKFDDGQLHLLAVNSGFLKVSYGLLRCFLGGNTVGRYEIATSIFIHSSKEEYIQSDGTVRKKGNDFHFKVLPGELKMRY